MSKNIIQKILNSDKVNCVVEQSVDLLMGHDGTACLVLDKFAENGSKIWDKNKVLIVFDHFAPPASIERANIQNKLLHFVKEHELDFRLYKGICHQLLVEDSRVVPGKVIVGADSHTVSAGALGCFATGVGSTDFLNVLETGKLWFKVPESYKIIFKGKLPPYIQGKDLVLEVIRCIGEDGAIYKVLEFHDNTEEGITMNNRVTISNMSVEMGAKAGIFCPDKITEDYVKNKGGEYHPVLPDADAVYSRELVIDVTSLKPMIAVPHSLVIKQVADVANHPITQAFIGSCTAGRLEDLEIAAHVFSNNKLNPYVKTIVIPSSQKVYMDALNAGYISLLTEAGVVISNPSCGPCCNIDKGLIGNGESCISTSNRNFQGRMGSLDSNVFLASTLTVAYSAVHGKIVDPSEFF